MGGGGGNNCQYHVKIKGYHIKNVLIFKEENT